MQHPCSRCGAAVDDNSPFCPACEAPQITLAPREHESEPIRLQAATFPAAAAQGYEPTPTFHEVSRSSGDTNFLRAAIYAGAVGSLLSTLPLGFIIGLPLAGALAVRLYGRWTHASDLEGARHFRLGAFAGLLAFGMLVVVRSIGMALFGGAGELRQGMVEAIHRAQSTNPDPQAQQVLQYFLTPQGLAVMGAFGLIFMCVVFVLLAGLGGLIGGKMGRQRRD